MKRLGAVALALLYALPSTWALQGGFNLVRAPRASEDRCAPHGCGCDESVRTRQTCCCAAVPGSSLTASRCVGTEAALAALLIPPALATTPDVRFPEARVSLVPVPDARPPRREVPGRIDKVPIL